MAPGENEFDSPGIEGKKKAAKMLMNSGMAGGIV